MKIKNDGWVYKMSDSPENMTGKGSPEAAYSNQICRVAYTLNNDQPVLCSIIGNQPMFYMDFEEDYDDESFLDTEELAILEREVTQLKREIDEYERFSHSINEFEEKKMQSIFDNAQSICSVKDKEDEFSKAALKQKVIETLSKSRAGKAYLDEAAKYNVNILVSSQVETALYDRKSLEIMISPNHDFETIVLLTARELRRHWQHRQGALINPLVFQPDNAILINRIQIADLTASMIRVAWELQLSGHKEIWERLEHSPMADLARAFAHEAFMDFRTINNGIASTAVFEAWFLSDRCKSEDKDLIQQMLADYQGYVFDGDEHISSVTAELIAALGSMPFGKNYLAQHAMTIMSDPIFTDVRDRSNANFLWFIKFERSFRETEQGLQKESSSHGHGSHDLKNGKTNNANSKVVQFSAKQKNAKPKTSQGVLDGESKPVFQQSTDENISGEKVVHLRRWNAEKSE